jgi:predicted ArsR family transcriptional regulator
MVIFPPLMRLILDDQTVITPEIIDQIHELILEDRRISAKSIAEQLGISRERVGS